ELRPPPRCPSLQARPRPAPPPRRGPRSAERRPCAGGSAASPACRPGPALPPPPRRPPPASWRGGAPAPAGARPRRPPAPPRPPARLHLRLSRLGSLGRPLRAGRLLGLGLGSDRLGLVRDTSLHGERHALGHRDDPDLHLLADELGGVGDDDLEALHLANAG